MLRPVTTVDPTVFFTITAATITYGTDTVQFSQTIPALDANENPAWLTVSKVWQPGDTDPNGGTVVSTSLRSIDGLSASTQSIGVSNPSTSVTTLQGNGNWTTTQTNPDGTFGITTYVDGRMVSSDRGQSLDLSAKNC
jgi:hypothetical protein